MNTLEKFLNQHQKATRESYKLSLKQFFQWTKSKPDGYINKDPEDIKEDIKQYWLHIKQKYKPKYTRNAKLNAVRQFLIEYEIEFPTVFWKRLKRGKDKGARALTQDRAPTRHELRKIILEGKPISRAMFLIATSTGMRIGEILQLKINDVDFEKKPTWINIRGETTKDGNPRTVYLSDEATISLKSWMKRRENWLKTARSRMEKLSKTKGFETLKNKHKNDNGTIFPVTRQTAESYWQTMLKRANLDMRDPSTNYRILHCHTLRKFFRTNMVQPLTLDITEALMGHKGYLTDAYRRYSKQELADKYLDAQKHITIIQEPRDVTKLEKDMDAKLQEKDQQITKLQQQLDEMNKKLTMMIADGVTELFKNTKKYKK